MQRNLFRQLINDERDPYGEDDCAGGKKLPTPADLDMQDRRWEYIDQNCLPVLLTVAIDWTFVMSTINT